MADLTVPQWGAGVSQISAQPMRHEHLEVVYLCGRLLCFHQLDNGAQKWWQLPDCRSYGIQKSNGEALVLATAEAEILVYFEPGEAPGQPLNLTLPKGTVENLCQCKTYEISDIRVDFDTIALLYSPRSEYASATPTLVFLNFEGQLQGSLSFSPGTEVVDFGFDPSDSGHLVVQTMSGWGFCRLPLCQMDWQSEHAQCTALAWGPPLVYANSDGLVWTDQEKLLNLDGDYGVALHFFGQSLHVLTHYGQICVFQEGQLLQQIQTGLEIRRGLPTHEGWLLITGQQSTNLWTFPADQSEDLPQPLGSQFHAQPLNDLQPFHSKPWVLSCAGDRKVNLWNYESRQLLVSESYEEVPRSLSVHPSDFQAVVAHEKSFRLVDIKLDGLSTVGAVHLANIEHIKFARAGHLISVGSIGMVCLYLSRNLEMVATLEDDLFRGSAIVDCQFFKGDTLLWTRTREGKLVETCIEPTKKEEENTHREPLKGHQVATGTTAWASGSLGSDEGGHYVEDPEWTCLTSHGDSTWGGTAHGQLKNVFTANQSATVHESPVSGVRITSEGNYCFSWSEGILFCWRLANHPLPENELVLTEGWLLEQWDREDKGLRRRINELKPLISFKLLEQEALNAQELEARAVAHQATLEAKNLELNTLTQKLHQFEEQALNLLPEPEARHSQEAATAEADFGRQLENEAQAFQRLQTQMVEEEKTAAQNLQEAHQTWAHKLEVLKTAHGQALDYENQGLQDLKAEKDREAEEWENSIQALEEQLDGQMEDLRNSHQKQSDDLKEDKIRLRGQAGIHKKSLDNFGAQTADVNQKNEQEIQSSQQVSIQIEEVNQQNALTLEALRQEERVVAQREETIWELKQKVDDLQKHKSVMEYRIKEAKAAMDPISQEMLDSRTKNAACLEALSGLQAKYTEYQGDIQANKELNLQISQEIDEWKTRLCQEQGKMTKLVVSLNEIGSVISDEHQLGALLTNLAAEYETTQPTVS